MPRDAKIEIASASDLDNSEVWVLANGAGSYSVVVNMTETKQSAHAILRMMQVSQLMIMHRMVSSATDNL